ncbi:hypothetical protein OG777_10370 [Micromonospora peucetia]|uniref:hypothetical protein n=1 Tax=Micromonospora peucetia TaxID=47871 RepID=UPI0022545CF5|nr:hypothetical protein [Micromonospora peucetia]MCX4387336.1 hypothetical protein [Micromonospora peucetia]
MTHTDSALPRSTPPPTPDGDCPNTAVRYGIAAAALLIAATVPAVAYPARLYAADVQSCPSSSDPRPRPAALSDTARHASATRMSHPRPARTALRELATRRLASPCDTAPGRFDLIHFQQWNNPPLHGTAVREVVRWRADDRSGAQLATSHPAGVVPVNRDWWRPGDLASVSPVNPFISSEMIRAETGVTRSPASDPNATVQAVARLATWYSPRRDARTATLGVLADLTGLTFYPRVVDRAGRVGVGVAAVASDGRRDLLILHPDTADVLAYENARPTVSGLRVSTYVLYLTHSHASRRWWEPPEPTAGDAAPPRPQHPQPQRHWLLTPAPPCHVPTTRGAPS